MPDPHNLSTPHHFSCWDVCEGRRRAVTCSIASHLRPPPGQAPPVRTRLHACRALDRILHSATANGHAAAAPRANLRRRGDPVPPTATHAFGDLPWRVQQDMNLLGLGGLSAAEALEQLRAVLRKSEAEEATARRKFQAARLRFVRPPAPPAPPPPALTSQSSASTGYT